MNKRKRRMRITAAIVISALAVTGAAIAIAKMNQDKADPPADTGSSDTGRTHSSSAATDGDTTGSGQTTETAPSSTSSQTGSGTTTKNRSASGTTVPRATSAATDPPSANAYIQIGTPAWNLKLVNPWNPIDFDQYKVAMTSYSVGKFDSRALAPLKELVSAGKKYNIRPCSMFRTYNDQKKLFDRRVNERMAADSSLTRAQAEVIVARGTARPTTSEHHLGLAVDFLFEDRSSLSQNYENLDAYRWMMDNCAEYGFILRYPKSKESVTGVKFEPWHYRYVGKEAAKEIMSRGITLEEYLKEKGL